MPQQARIFCERAKPLVTITKEHLFSRRVDRILMPELPGPDKSFERTTAGPDGLATSKTWPTQVIAAIEATVVCGSSADGCNGGWMSDLDGQVRQLLEPMMLGKPRTLSPEEQVTIATWTVIKSMVLEFVWGTEHAIVFPQEARMFVYRQQRPPANMQIRIAAVDSQGRPALIFRSSAAWTAFSRRPRPARHFPGLPRARPSSSAASWSRSTGPRASPPPHRLPRTDRAISSSTGPGLRYQLATA